MFNIKPTALKIDAGLRKHAAEFLGFIRNNKYERTESGLYFPRAKVFARGMYEHDVNGLDLQFSPNLVPTEGLNHLLSVACNGGTAVATWYLGLYSGNVSPASTWTAANVASNATEITSTSEGYSGSTRKEFTEAAPSGGAISNTASKAAFTIATATQLSVYGAFLASASARGATTGTLLSATKFASQRLLNDADVFNLGYTLTLTSS